MTFRQITSILWRRKIFVVASAVAVRVVLILYAESRTKSYTTSANIAISSSLFSSTSQIPMHLPSIDFETSAVQQAGQQYLLSHHLTGPVQVSDNFDATNGMLQIVATSPDPALAAAVANAYEKVFVNYETQYIQSKDPYTQTLNFDKTVLAYLEGLPTSAAVETQIGAVQTSESTIQGSESLFQNQATSYAELLNAAPVPSVPNGESAKKIAVLALLVGLLCGAGIALVLEQLDVTVHAGSDVEESLKLPVLGELPTDRSLRQGESSIASVRGSGSALGESLRDLRTSLQVILEDEGQPAGSKVLVVTSPAPGEGKTFVAANLAAAWAMNGRTVVVVSADLRRPEI